MQSQRRKAGTTLQRIVWTKRAQSWEETPNPGLDSVVEAIVARAATTTYDLVVDLGSGSGQLALPLAAFSHRVVAVDIAPTMLEILESKARSKGISNVETKCESLERLHFEANSVDLIVSNYVLHHLADSDKASIIKSCYQWLRPGGSLIIGDMMFGRGATAQDRQIIAEKVLKLAKLGPGGWWRIAKNAARFTFRIQEKPVSADTWRRYLSQAGFEEISISPLVAEASIAQAFKR
jgi:2-polyprenyl-3-methyl-5-hydroxy-6-metoxy-1,4-benzoquinol methylase